MSATERPTPDDVGRVYLHGTTVRVVLINDRGVADPWDPYHDDQVTIKCVEPTEDGLYPVVMVHYLHLTPTDERIEVTR
jgi:hypothetical protein